MNKNALKENYGINYDLLYTDRVIPPLDKFFIRCLKNVKPKLTETSIHRVLTTLLNLVGTEIEGKEVSLGIVLTDDINQYVSLCQAAAIQKDFMSSIPTMFTSKEKINLGSDPGESIREIVRFMRLNVVNWMPGYYEQPLIVCDIRTLEFKDVRILTCVTKTSRTPHMAYMELTKNKHSLAIWIKPTMAIRLYGEGRLLGQAMRLRDAGGWAARNLSDIYEYIKQRSKGTILESDDKSAINFFIYPAIAMSEERKGAAIYIVPIEKWEEEIKKLGVDSKIAGFKYNAQCADITSLTESEFQLYLEQDGCVIVSNEGKLLAVGSYFIGPGGRKKIADPICKSCNAQAIVVSQDGPIRFYSYQIEDESHAFETDPKEKDFRYVRIDLFRVSSV